MLLSEEELIHIYYRLPWFNVVAYHPNAGGLSVNLRN